MLALAGIILALWLGGAALALRSGLAMRRSARLASRQADRLADLLQSAPAIPVLIRPDGAIESPDRLASWLGRETLPGYVSELTSDDGGLEPEHARTLAQEIKATQRGGRTFVLPVRAAGSKRSLLVKGAPAGADLASPGTIVLWMFDATESQSRIEDLRGQVAQYREALEALSGVIEAAPMPVWHRTSDQRLSLVNSAYVNAVDGASAEQVINQGIELVETIDGLSPDEVALQAP